MQRGFGDNFSVSVYFLLMYRFVSDSLNSINVGTKGATFPLLVKAPFTV